MVNLTLGKYQNHLLEWVRLTSGLEEDEERGRIKNRTIIYMVR